MALAKMKRPNGSIKRRTGPFDAVLGEHIRRERKEQGLSQTVLAEAVGVTFQQVQKYEKGMNRVSVARFIRIARALDAQPLTMLERVMKEARA